MNHYRKEKKKAGGEDKAWKGKVRDLRAKSFNFNFCDWKTEVPCMIKCLIAAPPKCKLNAIFTPIIQFWAIWNSLVLHKCIIFIQKRPLGSKCHNNFDKNDIIYEQLEKRGNAIIIIFICIYLCNIKLMAVLQVIVLQFK